MQAFLIKQLLSEKLFYEIKKEMEIENWKERNRRMGKRVISCIPFLKLPKVGEKKER